jgi:branched-chain amino acid transport system permease protein
MAIELETILRPMLNGMQSGFRLFLIASGLTIVLGILDVLNLAHGELYALGAYVATSVLGYVAGLFAAPAASAGIGAKVLFVLVMLLAMVVAAGILIPFGAVVERVFLRPIYDRNEVYQLVLTFALLLVVNDVLFFGWGPTKVSSDAIASVVNSVPVVDTLLGFQYPTYQLLYIVVGAVVAAGLFYFFDRTKTGRIIRATAINREMATAIGVDTERTFTLVFALGAFFAGFAGALYMPQAGAQLGMGGNALVLSFVVIVIGGVGSLKGAFVAALLVGLSQNFLSAFPLIFELSNTGIPWNSLVIAAPYMLMIVVLLVRPEGLYGTWGETA